MVLELIYIPVGLVIFGYLANKLYFSGGVCKSKNRLDGKIAIITGSNTGIGYETALDFARKNLSRILFRHFLILNAANYLTESQLFSMDT